MGVTSDPNDPRIARGVDDEPIGGQHDVYLVLSDEERAKGFVRPVRYAYVHVGPPGPRNPLRDLTPEEQQRFNDGGQGEYVKFEPYPDDHPSLGRFWKQSQLDAVGQGCGAVTTMGGALAETYARDPQFYGATYCVHCDMHRPVGEAGEFVWDGTDQRVGT